MVTWLKGIPSSLEGVDEEYRLQYLLALLLPGEGACHQVQDLWDSSLSAEIWRKLSICAQRIMLSFYHRKKFRMNPSF